MRHVPGGIESSLALALVHRATGCVGIEIGCGRAGIRARPCGLGRRGRRAADSAVPAAAPVEHNYLILKPNVFVSTKDVFQDPELTRNSPPITIHGFLTSGGNNDCLGVVRRRYPEVARAIDWLSRFGAVRLTGTGACVFMACETTEGRDIMGQLPPGFDAYMVRGMNDSPLLERLAAG